MTTVCFWARAGPAARPAASTRAEVKPTARSMRRIIGASLDSLASDGGAPAPAASCGSPCPDSLASDGGAPAPATSCGSHCPDSLASDRGAPAPAASCGSHCPTWDSFEPSRPASLRHEAAVHDHLRAGHERGLVRGQEERGVDDLARLADAPQRDRCLELRPQ